ncbi:MAG: hypothetical protein AB9856_19135 [Cellulosilyticaceae bacterium]
MNNIYMPNIYRINNYRESTGAVIKIPYYQEFKGDDDLKLMMYVKTRKLIENIFLFDKVYVDVSELAVVVDNLCTVNEDVAGELFKSGAVTYIDAPEVVVGCTNGGYFSTLSYSSGKNKRFNKANELEEELFTHFKYRSQVGSVLDSMIEDSMYYRYDYGKDIVHKIAKDIDSEVVQRGLGISSTKHSYILKKDIEKINAYSEACRGLYLIDRLNTEKKNIGHIYLDDIIREVITAKVNYLDGMKKIIDMNKLLKIYELPDIELMLLYNQITIEDLMRIKEDSDFKIFKEWIINGVNAVDDDVIRAYKNTVQKRCNRSPLMKTSIMTAVTAIGCLNTPLGIGASMIDTFFIDKLIRNKDIDGSIDRVMDELKTKSNNKINLPIIYTDKYRKVYSSVE